MRTRYLYGSFRFITKASDTVSTKVILFRRTGFGILRTYSLLSVQKFLDYCNRYFRHSASCLRSASFTNKRPMTTRQYHQSRI